jgi:DeoR/GlpR family transcriptional regulator of sugar metabolism
MERNMTHTDFLSLERQDHIVKLVADRGRLTVPELSQLFDVSDATIRRDLAALAAQNRVQRVHGGVIRLQSVATHEIPIVVRQKSHEIEKERIGQATAALIQDGETLMLSGGSTGLCVARQLHSHHDLTIVTDSLLVVQELLQQGQHKVIMLGGTIDPEEQAVRGTLSRMVLEQLQVDKVIIGTKGISVQRGLSAETPEEAELFRTYMSIGDHVIVITDSSKFEQSALVQVVPLEAIHTLVTDTHLDADTAEQIRERGVYLLLV